MAADKISVDTRVSSALDRIKDLVKDETSTDSTGHVEPRNVEEAVDRLKRKVGDKAE